MCTNSSIYDVTVKMKAIVGNSFLRVDNNERYKVTIMLIVVLFCYSKSGRSNTRALIVCKNILTGKF